jgi:APA family basic amino acid/polyamine antiporter
VSTKVPPPVPAASVASNIASNVSDWERHLHQDKELVKGLGLTSATMLVMGSMIGSGIFIVSEEISREVTSPALLIGAWLITGFLTIVGALTYGELAAMMPRAGGQYVYLRESLGPLWGFLYGWTLFLVIQTGTIAAVGVAFGKFLGIFWPAVSSTHWIVHLWKVPKFAIGPMMLGGMDVGLNTHNLDDIRRFHPEHLHHRESRGPARPGPLRNISRPERAGDSGEFRRKLLEQFRPRHFA